MSNMKRNTLIFINYVDSPIIIKLHSYDGTEHIKCLFKGETLALKTKIIYGFVSESQLNSDDHPIPLNFTPNIAKIKFSGKLMVYTVNRSPHEPIICHIYDNLFLKVNIINNSNQELIVSGIKKYSVSAHTNRYFSDIQSIKISNTNCVMNLWSANTQVEDGNYKIVCMPSKSDKYLCNILVANKRI